MEEKDEKRRKQAIKNMVPLDLSAFSRKYCTRAQSRTHQKRPSLFRVTFSNADLYSHYQILTGD
jgi:hypothetical protein